MRLPFVPPKGCCRKCGRPVAGLDADYLCDECRGSDAPKFDRAASALRFEGLAREAIVDYKFHERLELTADFTDFLEAAVLAHFDPAAIDVVVPIPTTLAHRWLRGYNQCELLASALSGRLDRRYEAHALRRIGSPKRQSQLSERERRENAVGTFAASRPERIRGRTVLLLDDIMTTGSTLSEAAKTLKAAGAARVWCVTLARSIRV